MLKINIIVAITHQSRAIGIGEELLFPIKADMKRFVEITTPHPVIMGRKTWESIPEKFRPLKNRSNIVVTRQKDYTAEGARVVHSLEEAIEIAKKYDHEEIFIIGGAQIYTEALPLATRLYLTIIEAEKDGADKFFPDYVDFSKIIDKSEICHDEASNVDYYYLTLEK
jgi:dihydrofolate reductase